MSRYAFLSYDFPDRPNISNTGNVIQSIAAAAFLPRIDYVLPILEIDKYEPKEKTKAIFNGFFEAYYYTDDYAPYITDQVYKQWKNIDPLLISVHLSNEVLSGGKIPRVRDSAAKFFRAYGPVGTRDESTKKVLDENGIPAYKSLCLTLTLQKREGCKKHNKLVLADVSDKLAAKFMKDSYDEVLDITHLLKWYWSDNAKSGAEIMIGEYILDVIQGARLVVTNRLHIAAPALALETPLLFVPDTGESSKSRGKIRTESRLSDYADIFPIAYTKQILSGEYKIDVNCPPSNPEKYIPYREKMINTVREFIGDECPYKANGSRVSVFDKMKNLLDQNDIVNIKNHIITQQNIFFNRYRNSGLFMTLFREGVYERYYPLRSYKNIWLAMFKNVIYKIFRFFVKGDK